MDNEAVQRAKGSPAVWIFTWLSIAVAMLVLDITWLGLVAKKIYGEALGTLLRPQAYWPAALLFYAMYVSFVQAVAVMPSSEPKQAAKRGAAMGFFAYATYELTNWAVLANWPADIILIDVLWGLLLTGTIAVLGFGVKSKLEARGSEG